MTKGIVAQAVKRAVERDAVAVEAMRRDILNVAAYARWLTAKHRWRFSFDAVVSALHRYRSGLTRHASRRRRRGDG